MAVPHVPLFPVQAEGCAPLRRAWDLLALEFDFEAAATNPEINIYPPVHRTPPTVATGGIGSSGRQTAASKQVSGTYLVELLYG